MIKDWVKAEFGICGSLSADTSSFNYTDKAYIEAKDIEGNTRYVNLSYWSLPSSVAITSALVLSGTNASNGFAIGSGNTAESASDYTLESQITGIGMTVGAATPYTDSVNAKYSEYRNLTVTNNTGASITVNEVGLFASKYSSDTKGGTPTTGSSYRRSFMADRIVLDSPVVIPNGESRVIKYEVVLYEEESE